MMPKCEFTLTTRHAYLTLFIPCLVLVVICTHMHAIKLHVVHLAVNRYPYTVVIANEFVIKTHQSYIRNIKVHKIAAVVTIMWMLSLIEFQIS